MERTATADEIKRAYKKVAIKYHPDRNPGDKEAEEKFKQAAQAYDVLRDPDKRARYDQFGAAGVDGAAGGFGGFGAGGMDLNDIFRNFGDIFGGAFGGFGGFGGGRGQRLLPFTKTGELGTQLAGCLNVTGASQVRFEQKNGHVTQMSAGEIPVERRSGRGQLLVSVLLDDVVVYAGATE